MGSGHTKTWAWATLQLAIHELQYVLQHIVINKIIADKQLILVFLLHFLVALPPQPWPPPAEMAP